MQSARLFSPRPPLGRGHAQGLRVNLNWHSCPAVKIVAGLNVTHPRRNLHLLIGRLLCKLAGRVFAGQYKYSRQRVRGILSRHLHLRVDNARVLTLPVDVVDLGEVVLLAKSWVEDVVEVDGQDVQETGWS